MAKNTEKRIRAVMELDSQGFNKGLKQVNSELRLAQSELKNANAQVGVFGKDSKKLGDVQQAVAKQVELHSKKVDIYKQSIEKTTSKMKDNIKARDELKIKLEQANKKYEEAVKLYGKESTEAQKAKKEVDNLTEEYKKKEKAIETNSKQIQKYETNMNKANAEMVKAKGNLNQVTDELNKQNNKWVQASEKLGEHSKKLKDTGEKITDVGKNITTKVSAPLAGLGVIALKTTADYDDSMSQLKAITNSSAEDMEKLNSKAKEMGIQTRYSAKEASDSMVMLGQAGYKTNEILNTTPAVLNLAQAGAIDLTQSTDVLVSSMSQFGIATEKAGHVADVLSLGANKANLGVGDLAESMKYAGAMANTAGWSIEDTTAAIGIMSNYGIKGSQSGTVLRGAISRLVKPSKDAAETMQNLGIKVFDTQGKMKSLPQILDEVKKGTNKLTEEQKMNALVSMFGQEAVSGMNALMNEGGDSIRKYSKELVNADGSAKKAATTMEDNLGGSMRSLKSASEGALISIGTALAPTIRDVADRVTELTRRFANLSPETQKMIAKFGMFAIATGPAIIGVGKLTTGLGSIIGFAGKTAGAIGKLTLATKGVEGATKGIGLATGVASKGIGAMGLATKASALLLNPWALGIGAVALAGVGLAKHLKKDCIPSLDIFADETTYTTKQVQGLGQVTEKNTVKISNATKKQLGAYMDLDDKATKAMMSLKFNSTQITSENAKEITDTYSEMTKQTVQAIVDKNKKETDEMKKFFAENSMLSDEEEKKILEKKQKQCEFEKNIVEQGNARIKEIMNKASAEKRELTEEEKNVINNIQDNMKQNAVKHMSQSEVEQKVIMERLQKSAGDITAKQAGEVIKNSAKARDKTIKDANEKYDKTVAWAIRERDENKTISDEEADKIIAAAEREKRDVTQKAKDMHSNVVREAEGQCKEHISKIDIETGEVKSKWQILKDWFKNNPVVRFFKSVGKDDVNNVGHNWTGTNYWQGGLTYLHDQPGKNANYELYDLPRGTRVYNHDASADMVRRAAEQVATRVANSVLSGFNGANGVNVTQNIYSPTASPSEVARQTKNSLRELALNF